MEIGGIHNMQAWVGAEERCWICTMVHRATKRRPREALEVAVQDVYVLSIRIGHSFMGEIVDTGRWEGVMSSRSVVCRARAFLIGRSGFMEGFMEGAMEWMAASATRSRADKRCV